MEQTELVPVYHLKDGIMLSSTEHLSNGSTSASSNSKQYTTEEVSGTACIIWHFPELATFNQNAAKKEKERRRKVKDSIGADMKDIPMMDSRLCSNGKEYCDAIVYTDTPDRLATALTDIYEADSHTTKRRTITGGYQLLWHKDDILSVSLSVFKNKLMAQPGLNDQGNLLEWVSRFSRARGKLANPSISSPSAVDDRPDPPPSRESTPTDDLLNPQTTPQAMTTSFLPAARLVVSNIPPEPAVPEQNTNQSPATLPGKVSTNSDKTDTPVQKSLTITNEMLCYLQNKIESLPMDILAKACAGHYSGDEIKATKKLFFEAVVTRKRLINRKGDNKRFEDTKDIIKAMLEFEVHNAPIFVARDLSNLPPLSLDNCDLVKLARDLETLKSDMTILKDNQKTMADIVQVRAPPIQKVDASTDPNSNTSHVPLLNEIFDLGITQQGRERSDSDHGLSDADSVSDEGSTQFSQVTSPSELTSDDDQFRVNAVGEDIEQGLYDQEEDFPPLPHLANTNQRTNVFSRTFTSTSYKATLLNSRGGSSPRKPVKRLQHRPDRLNPEPRIPRKSFPGSDRYTRQTSDSEIIIGKGHSRTLGAGNADRPHMDNLNKQCIGVFITRLKPRVTEKQLALHIKRETGLTVRPERLQTKYQTYRSYFIPGNKAVRSAILQAELWPAPTLLKPFYN